MNPDTDGSLAPWGRDIAGVLALLSADGERGLARVEALRRRDRYGPNTLKARKPRHLLAILVEQFRSVVVLLLLAAGLLAIFFGHPVEALAIFTVLAVNTTIGWLTEWRATRSMEALGRLAVVATRIIRDGQTRMVPAEDLVPGDLVVLEAGDVVTADIRLIEAAKLQADESTLTGESLPVDKQTDAIDPGTALMERSNMLFKGTAVTRGAGKGVVAGTGLATEFGRIFRLVAEAEPHETPLEKRLDALGNRLAVIVIAIAVLLAVGGVLAGRDLYLAVEVAIALAVAAIPEGLPVVATIALARGMWRMAKRNALIAKLSAVETLGATSVILTDKTGTLTENRMTVTAARTALSNFEYAEIASAGGCEDPAAAGLLDELLATAVLCNNAALTGTGNDGGVGDPMEVALLVAASRRRLLRDELLRKHPELREIAFDPATKLMATLHEGDGGVLVAVKGAPEAVLPRCVAIRRDDADVPLTPEGRGQWLEFASHFGAEGLRTLAIATGFAADVRDDPYTGLVFLGLLGLEDPPRAGVREAIAACRSAGIAVIMVTGDHAATARKIAADVGLLEHGGTDAVLVDGNALDAYLAGSAPGVHEGVRIFSRVTPEQKLALIDTFQRRGHVVAMTGDGVNDAPALKKADIGVAMGIRGTAVAREAAAMVLLDDNFGTIVAAVAQGRVIFDNIRKFVVYLLSCNISEVLIVALATIAGAPLPLLPLQILFLNLVTDVFPALALGVGRGSGAEMNETPRPATEGVLARRHWLTVALHGLVIAGSVLAAMATAIGLLGLDHYQAVSISFCTLAFAQLWHVFNMRAHSGHPLHNEITRNPWVWLAIALCVCLILSAFQVPLLARLLQLSAPGLSGWMLILLFSILPLVLGPAVRGLVGRLSRN